MVHLVWDQYLETGIDAIDAQHRQIVDYINELHDAISHKDRAVVGETIDHLCDYVATHFVFEENLMEKAGYPQTTAHKAAHEGFARSITSYKQRFDAGEDIARQLRSGLCIWLVEHIKREDGAYVEKVQTHLSGNKHP